MVYQPKFTWAKGSHHKVDAQTAGEVCNSLEAEGRLTAADLVEESRPEEAPLHPEFEWDDSIAAEKYREVQAGGVIRHLVKVSIDVEEAQPIRAFFPVTVSEKTYERIEAIISVEDKRQVLLNRALSELKSFRIFLEAYTKLRSAGRKQSFSLKRFLSKSATFVIFALLAFLSKSMDIQSPL